VEDAVPPGGVSPNLHVVSAAQARLHIVYHCFSKDSLLNEHVVRLVRTRCGPIEIALAQSYGDDGACFQNMPGSKAQPTRIDVLSFASLDRVFFCDILIELSPITDFQFDHFTSLANIIA